MNKGVLVKTVLESYYKPDYPARIYYRLSDYDADTYELVQTKELGYSDLSQETESK